MALVLYELAGRDEFRFSPPCWRTLMAVAHKGLKPDERVPVKFSDKSPIAFSGQDRVPVLTDGDTWVADSFEIACYLEDAYADRPSLFGGDRGRAMARFVNEWTQDLLVPGLVTMLVRDEWDHVRADDRDCFRQVREERFGDTLENLQAGRDHRVHAFRERLAPLRVTLNAQPFLSGTSPAYADYIVFGLFQFPRCVSAFPFIEKDDPIYAWRESMLDLFDGLAREAPGYPV